MSTSIIIRSGKTFDFNCPHNSAYSIKDIAHALANMCRFTGHTKFFYSVAQHSVLMSYAVPEEHALAALLHKSAQAFTGVLSKEVQAMLPGHHDLEMQVLDAIFERFGVPTGIPGCVEQASIVVAATEHRDILPQCPEKQEEMAGIVPLEKVISPWFPSEACRYFLTRYKELMRPLPSESINLEGVSVY